jgi:mono/diheme cytochrome c family protein
LTGLRTVALGLCGAVLLLAGTPRLGAEARAQDAAAMEESRAIFEEYCAACHGFDGIKVIPQAPSFATGEALDKDDPELLESLRTGKGDLMPPWAEVLSDDEMASVLAFIKTLQGPQ